MGLRIRAGGDGPEAAKAIAHPVRIRVLEVLSQRDMSPVEFCRARFAGDVATDEVADHFRALAECGCLEVVATRGKRTAEHVYRGLARPYFSDAQWSELGEDERVRVSEAMIEGLSSRIEGALAEGTFDSRLDRHLSFVAMKLDEQGWREMATALTAAFGEIEQIRGDAERRLVETDGEGIPATCGLLGFPSPADPKLARPVPGNA